MPIQYINSHLYIPDISFEIKLNYFFYISVAEYLNRESQDGPLFKEQQNFDDDPKKKLDKGSKFDYSKIMKLSNYSKIFKALSNEQRLKIFMMIYQNCCAPEGSEVGTEFRLKDESATCCSIRGGLEKAFTKICDCMNLSRSTISHHFKELQNAGLIICEREGQIYRCTVNEEAVTAIKDFLK